MKESLLIKWKHYSWAGPLFYLIAVYLRTLSPQFADIIIVSGVGLWMLFWWITEPVPIGLTSLLPAILFPMHDILPFRQSIENYYSPIILLFMGGFIIGYSLEKWNVHKKIALLIMSKTGSSPLAIIKGMMVATFFISMWISNTATAIMMLPIAISVLNLLKIEKNTLEGNSFGAFLILSIAYGANIGGVATLVGTPPNIVFKGLVMKQYGKEVYFLDWMLVALPIGIVMLFTSYYILKKAFLTRIPSFAQSNIKQIFVSEGIDKPLDHTQRKVLWIFALTAIFWVFSQAINWFLEHKTKIPLKLTDTNIAMFFACCLMLIPSKGVRNYKPLVVLPDLAKLPWQILLMFGGGLCLALAMQEVGIIVLIGNWIQETAGGQWILLSFMVILIGLFMTELMSNVALTSIITPLVFALTNGLNLNNILVLGLPVTIAASFAFMMPISTPPNAIVYASGYIPLRKMISSGFIVNIIGAVLLWITALLLQKFF